MLLKSQILYEDPELIVVYKPAGIPTQTSKVGQPDMVSEVKNYLKKNQNLKGNQTSEKNQFLKNKQTLKKNGPEPYLALIHRLDQPVEGILVMGKTPAAGAHLNKQLTEHMIDKHYLAAVCGKVPCKNATVVDYLLKDEKTNLSSIVEQDTVGAKKAVLEFQVEKTIQREVAAGETEKSGVAEGNEAKEHELSLLDIHLITGRHHQIRVQFSGANMPLLGDLKYGNDETRRISQALGVRTVALCSNRLSFLHPVTKERLTFHVTPKGSWYRLFD